MINLKLIVSCMVLLFLSWAGRAVACDVHLSCDDILVVHVSEGTEHLSGGKTRTHYVACVDIDPAKKDLKEAYADCPDDVITIWIGGSSFEVPKVETTPRGDWFCIVCSTSEEALGVAMKMCPDKVKSYLP